MTPVLFPWYWWGFSYCYTLLRLYIHSHCVAFMSNKTVCAAYSMYICVCFTSHLLLLALVYMLRLYTLQVEWYQNKVRAFLIDWVGAMTPTHLNILEGGASVVGCGGVGNVTRLVQWPTSAEGQLTYIITRARCAAWRGQVGRWPLDQSGRAVTSLGS